MRSGFLNCQLVASRFGNRRSLGQPISCNRPKTWPLVKTAGEQDRRADPDVEPRLRVRAGLNGVEIFPTMAFQEVFGHFPKGWPPDPYPAEI